jgi:Ser/Thr protein kinase RdoA (MazF antagonist)
MAKEEPGPLLGRADELGSADVEVPLEEGNTTAGLVRVGSTVRRPSGPWSPAVHALLVHLAGVGYAGAPRSLGFDEQGRHVVEYVEGEVDARFAPDRAGLMRVGSMMRDLHDAVAGFVPPPDATWNVVVAPDEETLVVHHDLAPWNLVRGERWVFIDWDNAGPGSRLWDLAYAAHGFVPLAPQTDPVLAAARLAALVDGYGLDEDGRRRLPPLIVGRALAVYHLLRNGHEHGIQPWARHWAEGHGEVWSADATYAHQHADRLTHALLH